MRRTDRRRELSRRLPFGLWVSKCFSEYFKSQALTYILIVIVDLHTSVLLISSCKKNSH
jgi:hypothetical protein